MLLVSSGERPGMRLNILCIRVPLQHRDPNVNGAEIESPEVVGKTDINWQLKDTRGRE